jgi:methylglutaconyl-CoA hydratase
MAGQTASSAPVLCHIDARGVATVTLNRPDKHNAFDAPLLQALQQTLTTLAADKAVRVVVLTGAGKSFCSGADLAAMRALLTASEADNLRDALGLTEVLATLNAQPQPTVARVNGNAFGGAVGLIACCDIAVAKSDARFGLTEIKLGLVPAAISPYVLPAIGVRQARRYFLSGELFDAEEGRRLGLIHECAPADGLDAAVDKLVTQLLLGGPVAQLEAKQLVAEVDAARGRVDAALRESTARRLARLRVSDEGQEGMSAFLEKRPARWAGHS